MTAHFLTEFFTVLIILEFVILIVEYSVGVAFILFGVLVILLRLFENSRVLGRSFGLRSSLFWLARFLFGIFGLGCRLLFLFSSG